MFQSTHKLDFLSSEWPYLMNTDGWHLYKVGTCNGQWRSTLDAYEILSVINDKPGNGHFNDIMEWFENSCKRDKRILRIREVWNKELHTHMLTKRGFEVESGGNLIKKF
jgi:hypothetical protein